MKVNRIPRLSNLWKSASNFLAAIREVISLAWSASSIPLQMKKSLRKQTNPQAGKKEKARHTGADKRGEERGMRMEKVK